MRETYVTIYLKKVLLLLIALCALTAHAQYPTDPMTKESLEEVLKDLSSGSISVGNGCDEYNFMTLVIDGDMDMNYNDLEVLYAHITVRGKLLNEGTITLSCDLAIFEVLDELEDDETLSIPTVSSMEYKVYPNPAHEFVYIQGNGLKYVYIYDMNGRIVKQYALSTFKNKITLYGLESAIYLLNIRDEYDRSSTFKLIVR
jgi:hypothetical protein